MTISHNLEIFCICFKNKIYVQESQKDYFFREINKFNLFNLEKVFNDEKISKIQANAIKKIGESLQTIWDPIIITGNNTSNFHFSFNSRITLP